MDIGGGEDSPPTPTMKKYTRKLTENEFLFWYPFNKESVIRYLRSVETGYYYITLKD